MKEENYKIKTAKNYIPAFGVPENNPVNPGTYNIADADAR